VELVSEKKTKKKEEEGGIHRTLGVLLLLFY
jgi:hypothetical protein